jgi:hypothetical protein
MNEQELIKVKVIRDHKVINNFFPLGFETVYYKDYTTEDKISKGWVINSKIEGVAPIIVPDSLIPKGTFIDCIFIDNEGAERSSNLLYQWTGLSIGEIFEKL